MFETLTTELLNSDVIRDLMDVLRNNPWAGLLLILVVTLIALNRFKVHQAQPFRLNPNTRERKCF